MIDPNQIEAGIEALSGINWPAALAAVQAQNAQGELQTAEQLASLLAQFVPQALYVKDALEVVGFFVKMQDAGYIAPAQPEDPAMQRAAGHDGIGQNRT